MKSKFGWKWSQNQIIVRFSWKFRHQSVKRCWARVWHWYFKILYLISIFKQIGHKFKTIRDLHKNLHLINLERVECDILRYFIQILNLDKLILKLKSHRIYLKLCSWVKIWKCLKRIWHHYFNIIYLKYKFGQIGPNIKASLNLHKYWR